MLSTLKDRGDLYQQDGKWFARANIDWQTLPAKVEGVIKVRIGRLPSEQRELLSVASIQGESFIGEAVAQVQRQDERDVIRTFSGEIDKRHRLVQSERMERLGRQRLSHYRFRHNLFQQYVYSNLAETERNYLHEDIAIALEEIYGEKVKDIAPQLAWHFEQAGDFEKTFKYLLLAGRQAQMLGSNKEAITHYERGLALINKLTTSPELIPIELGFQAGLGIALSPVEGFQSKRVRAALGRALELCRQTEGANAQLMPIYTGLASYAITSNDLSLKTCLEWLGEFKAIADKQKDLVHLAAAETSLTLAHFLLGHNSKAIEIGRSVLSYVSFDQTSHENMIRYYAHDQRVALAPRLAWALCFKGKLNEAKALIAKEPISNFRHAASKAIFLGTCFPTYQCMHDFTSAKAISEDLLDLTDKYGYSFWGAWGLVCHGWARAQLGEVDTGISEMQQGLSIARMAGGLPVGSYLLLMLAEGLYLRDEYNEILNILEEAFEHCRKKDEFCYLSQLNCLKGECLQKLGAENVEVEKYFRESIAVAKQQDTPLLELQASISLAKYWQINDKKEEGHSLLTGIIERVVLVTDIDAISEYKEAKEILMELAQ